MTKKIVLAFDSDKYFLPLLFTFDFKLPYRGLISVTFHAHSYVKNFLVFLKTLLTWDMGVMGSYC